MKSRRWLQAEYLNDVCTEEGRTICMGVVHVFTVLPVFESFEDSNAQEWHLALTSKTAQSRNLVLICLENSVLLRGGKA